MSTLQILNSDRLLNLTSISRFITVTGTHLAKLILSCVHQQQRNVRKTLAPNLLSEERFVELDTELKRPETELSQSDDLQNPSEIRTNPGKE